MIAGLALILIRRRRAAAEADAAAAANMPGYFDTAYNASSLGHVKGMPEMYKPPKEPKTALRG